MRITGIIQQQSQNESAIRSEWICINVFFKALYGGCHITRIKQKRMKIVVRVDVIWFDCEGLVVAGDGLIQPPQGLERTTKVVMCRDGIGIDGEGLVITGDGLIRLPQIFERNTKVVMRLGVIGLDGEGFVIAGDSLIRLPQVLERNAKIAMRLSVIGLDGEGFVIACHGLIQFPQFFEHVAKVVMRLGVIRLDGESLGDEINGNVVIAPLVGDHTKQMQSDRLVGFGLQYLFIDSLSLRQATHSVVLHSQFQGLLDV